MRFLGVFGRARHVAELRRAGGSLAFFTYISPDDGSFDEDAPWEGKCSAVVHAPEGVGLVRTKAPGSKTMRMRVARLGFAAGVDVPDFALDADHLMPPLQDVFPAGSWLKWFHFRAAINGHPRLETKLLGYARTQRRQRVLEP